MKYCPKCGSPNDDAAGFCSKCGKPIAAPASGAAVRTPSDAGSWQQGQTPQPASTSNPRAIHAAANDTGDASTQAYSATSGRSARTVTPQSASQQMPAAIQGGGILRIVAIACAVAALVFSMLPWVSIDQQLVRSGDAASSLYGGLDGLTGGALSSNTGVSGSNFQIKPEYCMFDLGSLAKTIETYQGVQNTANDIASTFGFGGSGSSGIVEPQRSSAPGALGCTVGMVVWAVCVACAVIGLIVALATKMRKMKLFGVLLIPLAVFGFAWLLLCKSLGNVVSGAPVNVIVCIVLCIVGVVVAFISSSKAQSPSYSAYQAGAARK